MDLPFLAGDRFFSIIDFQAVYLQLEVEPKDREKTTFTTTDGGLYQFKVQPFGLCNAQGTCEGFMEHIFNGLQYKMLMIYLDIIIFASDFEEMNRLRAVLDRICDAQLKLKLSNCIFFRERSHV